MGHGLTSLFAEITRCTFALVLLNDGDCHQTVVHRLEGEYHKGALTIVSERNLNCSPPVEIYSVPAFSLRLRLAAATTMTTIIAVMITTMVMI